LPFTFDRNRFIAVIIVAAHDYLTGSYIVSLTSSIWGIKLRPWDQYHKLISYTGRELARGKWIYLGLGSCYEDCVIARDL